MGFYALRRRSGLYNGKLADAGRSCGISDDPYAFNAWSYFSQKLASEKPDTYIDPQLLLGVIEQHKVIERYFDIVTSHVEIVKQGLFEVEGVGLFVNLKECHLFSS